MKVFLLVYVLKLSSVREGMEKIVLGTKKCFDYDVYDFNPKFTA